MQRKVAPKIFIVSLLIVFLAGCSSIKLGYRLMDNAIRWKVNDYVSLNNVQSAELTRGINNFHRWHQKTQLPLYASFLGRKAIQFEQATLSPADVSKIYDEAFSLAMLSLDQLGPVITNMLLSLDDEQIPVVISNLKKESAKDLRKDFAISQSRRIVKRQNKMIKRISKLTGGLNQTQRDMIAAWANKLPVDKTIRVERQDRFVEVLSTYLNERSDPARFRQNVMAQFKTPERFSSPAYQQSYKKRKQMTLQLMSDLFNALTPTQKTRLIASVKKYQFDFLSLVPKVSKG